ncbi:MAG: glycoside hydrolase family 43 protein [Phycisphaerales bacterium]|nr:glycoside hydrolase family 43 protein [Phycisphaerales bacterium]
MNIENPILPGFNPDPSIIRVGLDYYLATSTFQWWPGVRLYHSSNLADWRLLGHALTRTSQLDMRANPSSGGVWAPALGWHDGVFYLVYTDVKNQESGFVDAHNYLVTTTDIEAPGQWSERIPLNSGGFDPSLFHDDDGRKWLVNMTWNHRSDNKSGGIVLQEYDSDAGVLIGSPRLIFAGTRLGGTEAPHLYRHGEWYILLVAEGGTGYGHAVTMARSRSIEGPYEVSPRNPILTSRDEPTLPLQKAGHASLVDTPDGRHYLAYLCGRPLPGTRSCTLGRETALVECRWTDDGWLELVSGSHHPAVTVEIPEAPREPVDQQARVTFDGPALPQVFNTLREPHHDTWCSTSERPGWLRLRGRESPGSRFDVSLVARRLESHEATCRTCMDFQPAGDQQFAGLVCWYDERNFALLGVSSVDGAGRYLALRHASGGRYREGTPVPLGDSGVVHLEARFHGVHLSFAWSEDGEQWHDLPDRLDAGFLSDESCDGFTGTFVGMSVHDLAGNQGHADFNWFEMS